MSLEDKIENLTKAVNNLILVIVDNGGVFGKVVESDVKQAAPKTELKKVEGFASKQIVFATEEAKPEAVAMPPVFDETLSVVEPVKDVSEIPPAPFNTMEGLTDYTTKVYKADESKGPKIQKIINDLGYTSITDVKPEQFALFYGKVQAL